MSSIINNTDSNMYVSKFIDKLYQNRDCLFIDICDAAVNEQISEELFRINALTISNNELTSINNEIVNSNTKTILTTYLRNSILSDEQIKESKEDTREALVGTIIKTKRYLKFHKDLTKGVAKAANIMRTQNNFTNRFIWKRVLQARESLLLKPNFDPFQLTQQWIPKLKTIEE